MLERNVALAGLLVIEGGIAVAECAPAAVLAGESNRRALEQERAEGQGLAETPVVGPAILPNLEPTIQHGALDFLHDMEAFGSDGDRFDDFVQGALGDRRVAGFVGVGWLKNRCGAAEGALFLFALGWLCDLAECGFELRDEFGLDLSRVFFCDCAECGGLLGEFGAQQGMAPDDIVEVGLGEGGFVRFVVPVAPVAVNINHHIAAELLAELQRDLRDFDHGEGIFTIHMENRRVDHLGDVGAVARGAGVRRQGGEADLVVHDEVDGATGAVALEL